MREHAGARHPGQRIAEQGDELVLASTLAFGAHRREAEVQREVDRDGRAASVSAARCATPKSGGIGPPQQVRAAAA